MSFLLVKGKLGVKLLGCDISYHVFMCERTFALGQVTVEAQWTDKLKEEDGDGCDNEQHHKHHHPN